MSTCVEESPRWSMTFVICTGRDTYINESNIKWNAISQKKKIMVIQHILNTKLYYPRYPCQWAYYPYPTLLDEQVQKQVTKQISLVEGNGWRILNPSILSFCDGFSINQFFELYMSMFSASSYLHSLLVGENIKLVIQFLVILQGYVIL